MEFFAKIVKGYKTLTVFTKIFIIDVWQGSKYASDIVMVFLWVTFNIFYTLFYCFYG